MSAPAVAPDLTVDPRSAVAPYEQVRVQLADQMADGTLPVGTRLPTVRTLAADLGLAVNTVARVYRELEAAGLVETRGRNGTFVSAAVERRLERAHAAAEQYAAAARALGLDRDEAVRIVTATLDAR